MNGEELSYPPIFSLYNMKKKRAPINVHVIDEVKRLKIT